MVLSSRVCIFFSIIYILSFSSISCANKYSKEANVKFSDHFEDDPKIEIRGTDKPFRMAKLNLLWSKAKLRLSEPKLKSFYSNLKLHDKEEIAYKHFIATGGGDKDGLKEAELRKKLIGIMSTYDLLEHFHDLGNEKKLKAYDSDSEAYFNRNIFKDKKLNKLWMKAEMAGFTTLELQVLKEEFSHHQDKIDQYYTLLKDAENADQNAVDEDLDRFNAIEHLEESNDIKNPQEFEFQLNDIRNKGRDIKDGFDRLERLSAQGPNSKEFVEPKVQGLWLLAVSGNFSRDELESLRTELHHYEKRLLKLRNLHLEHAVHKNGKDAKLAGEKVTNNLPDLEQQIKKQSRKVEKLHSDLESRIVTKNEL